MTSADQIGFIRDHLTRPIVFIGMMGAGKTTVARHVAEQLGWRFIDSDHEIEKDEGLSVSGIFETRGEPAFRVLEKNKIAQLLNEGTAILSVGGGAITTPETAEKIFSRALCLWLDAPVDVLVNRTSSKGNRPLLTGRDAKEALTERMAQRRHLYERAQIHIDGSAAIQTVTDRAMGQIYNYLIKQAV